jgi:chromosome segregation ATPase
MLCDCTHPKGEHAGLTYACWGCDCKRYTPDIQAASLAHDLAELEATDPSVAEAAARLDEATAAILARAETMPTESTAAQLRRVEQERDELRADLNEMAARKVRMQGDLDAQLAEAREQLAHAIVRARKVDPLRAELASALAELTSARGDRDSFLAERNHLVTVTQGLRAELASARAELGQLRAQLAERSTP